MTGVLLNGKKPDLERLQAEITGAGVQVPYGLGTDSVTVYTFDADGRPADLPAQAEAIVGTHTPPVAARNAVVAMAQSAVGVALTDLTAAQRNALLAALLYKNGMLDRQTMTILPVARWLRDD